MASPLPPTPPQNSPPIPRGVAPWIRRTDLMTLRLYATICDERSMTRAAVRESIAASAVTKRLRDFEETLGVSLLYRDSKGVAQTSAGAIVEHHVRRMLDELDALHQALNDYSQGIEGHLRLWCTESCLVDYLAQEIATFCRRYPQVGIELQEGDSAEVLQAVASGEADVGICAQATEMPGKLENIPFRKDTLVAAMPMDHPFATRQKISFEELLDTDFIGWSPHSSLIRRLQEAATGLGRVFRPKYRVASTDGALSLVRAGLGVSILPAGMALPIEETDRLRTVPLTDAWAHRTFRLYTRPGRAADIANAAFIQHLVESAPDFVRQA